MLTPLAWLLGFLLPACGMSGAQGVPATPPDFAHLVRPASPNTALAAPAGYTPAPDITTPVYGVPPSQLFTALHGIAAAQPHTFTLAEDAGHLREGWVVRSVVFNFPDIVWAEVRATPAGTSELLLYSRSVYGYGDFGVNRRRIEAWIKELATAFAASNKH